ncbi:hypothetical protein [Streptomyces sp. NPDC048636]|uniref:hypothetical protein n=1 Tax=Streptomyces sp. NPDC048636 TaxID=3155762 RepID=UPI003443FDF4
MAENASNNEPEPSDGLRAFGAVVKGERRAHQSQLRYVLAGAQRTGGVRRIGDVITERLHVILKAPLTAEPMNSGRV